MTFITRHKIPLMLFFLGIVLFSSTWDAQLLFSWDDNRYLEENMPVQNFQVGKIFTEAYWGSYIPITLFSYALEYAMWGLDPTGYHVVNTLIHALNGVLVYLFLLLLTQHRSASIIGAVLFIVHPVQVESVAWIAQRKNLLSMFFFLLAFISHIQSRQKDSEHWLWTAWGFYLLSVLSKPAVVGAPLLFMAYDYFFARISLRRTVLSALVPAAIAVFGAAAIVITSSEVGGIKELWGGSRWSALQLTFLTTWENLIGLMDISAHSPHYKYFEDVIQGNWRVWAGLLVLICFAGVSIYSLVRFIRDKNHRPMTFFLFLWVGAFMLPVSNIIPIAIQRSDRHIYFPSVLLFLMVGLLFSWLWQRYREINQRHVLVGSAVALTCYFMIGTHQYARAWNNSETLWTYHLKKYPKDDIAVNNLAMNYFRTKQYPQALQTYKKLERMAPEGFRPYLFPGLIADEQKRYDDAIRYFRQAIPLADPILRESIFSQLLDTYSKAVTQAENEKRFADVVDYLYGVVELLPNNHVVHKDLGNAYRKLGDVNAAETAYQKAIAFSEEYYSDVYAEMGHLLLNQGREDEARSMFEECLSKGPSPIAASGMCKILAAKGETQRALEACYIAATFAPDSKEYADQLANTLLQFHSPDKALAIVAKQLKGHPEVMHLVSGLVCVKSDQHRRAVEYFEKSSLPLSLISLGTSALSLEDYGLADTTFQKVLKSNPDNREAIGGRCLTLLHLQGHEKAATFCKKAAEYFPRDIKYLSSHADVLMAKKRTDEAIVFYEKAIKEGAKESAPKLAAAYLKLGQTAESKKWTGDALKSYQKAVALHPDDKVSHFDKGRMLLKQQRYAEALKAFDQAIDIDPEYALAHMNKAIAAKVLGDKEVAQSAFEQTLSIDPELPQALEEYCSFLKEVGEDAEPVCSKVRKG